jgi:hypothetical protein
MIKIDDILESKEVVEYLKSRGISEQYRKARDMIIGGFPQKFDFKLRKPKIEKVYQFRINKKYRAFGFFRYE